MTGATVADDLALPFSIEGLPVRGRIVRLGATVERVLAPHNYPAAVARAVGEGLVIVSMLGTGLKIEATLTLQTSSDGPLHTLVADFRSPGTLRGLAQYEKGYAYETDRAPLLGEGSLAFTIDPGGDMDRYQGIVPLAEGTLTGAALEYFDRSEQIPTLLRLAVGQHYAPGKSLEWRAGGILLQRVAGEGGFGDLRPMADDDWTTLELLMKTVTDDELLDPTLAAETLAYRLFHEQGVRALPAQPLAFGCRCSSERVANILRSYTREELEEFIEGGVIRMTCEFCGSEYDFDPDRLDGTDA